MVVYHVYKNGKPLGILETNRVWACNYWLEKKDANYTLEKEERGSIRWP